MSFFFFPSLMELECRHVPIEQQFFITAIWLRADAGGSLRATRSWISSSPSSFPLAFSYLSV
uniref:Uncharacterized protein n=1 Tax=Anguilla anguilla TaxID=7936 RepID=A0A0E9XR03_ANGAN